MFRLLVNLLQIILPKKFFYILFKKFKKKIKLDNIVFLHIGKCGGNFIGDFLGSINNHYENNLFSKAPHLFTYDNLTEKNEYIFSIRNPLDRFISGFNSRKRKIFNKDKKLSFFFEKNSFKFFASANELAEGIYSKNIIIRFQSRIALNSIKHIKDGYQFWISQSQIEKKPPLFIFEIEKIDEDIKFFLIKMNFDKNIFEKNLYNKNSKKITDDVHLSESAIHNLEKYFKDEINFYKQLKQYKKKINNNLKH